MYGLTRLRQSSTQVAHRAEGRTVRSPLKTAPQKAARERMTGLMARPDASCEPVQDLDPESATFGQVFWMLDFDGLE